MVDLTGLWRTSRAVAATGDRAKGAAQPSSAARRLAAVAVAALVLAAAGVRLVPILVEPSINWWDEIFQTIEPAHRLVYGYGLVPWEFQLGMRSWLLPGLVTGLMQAARLFGDGPDYYLPVVATSFALLASTSVICCFLWARRWFGVAGALAAAAVVAMAPELVYFGARALSEVVAAHLLLIGVYLMEPVIPTDSRRRLLGAGILLGLACLLRIQLAPAVALVALWSVWNGWRARLPTLAVGGVVALAFGAALDWVTLGYPLASVWRNFLYNIVEAVSAGFGTEPWSYYLLGEIGLWNGGTVFLLIAAALGARRLPVLAAAAVAILAVHSGIAHKEYRFIYPAVLMLTVLAGLGVGQLTEWGAEWLRRQGISKYLAGAVCAALLLGYFGFLMFRVWSSDTMLALRHRVHDNLLAASFVSRLPSFCGLGLYGEKGLDWARYGGYTYLHRPVPMYWPEDEAELAATAPAFDILLFTAPPPAALGFETVRCFGNSCIARRAGGCEARPMPPMPFPDPVRALAPKPEAFEAVPQALREDGR